MVQPVRLVLGFSTLLALGTVAARAAAEPLPASCRTGLVLGVADQDAEDIVGAVCNAAKRRGTTGAVRVSVLAAGNPRVRVGVARLTDTKEPEQTAHAEAANVSEAIRIAPTVLEALESTSTKASPSPPPPPPPPPPSPSPSPPPASASPPPNPVHAPEPPPVIEAVAARSPEPPNDKPTSALETKAGPPAAWIGVHGSSALAGGGTGFGGGAAVGVDHRSAQGFIDYSNSSGSPTGEKFRHNFLAIGARIKLSQSAFKPVIGGGWSYVDYENGDGIGKTTGQGIGVFGEAGAIYAIEKHQIIGIARLNLGLYEEKATRPYSYTSYDGQRVDTYATTSGANGPIASSFAFMAGYGYVFR